MNNGKKRGFVHWTKTYAGKQTLTSVGFLIVPIVLLITFTFIPAINLFTYSFQNITNVKSYGFVGLDNYKTIFEDPDYFITFKNSLYYLVGSFIQQILALLVASILCSKIFAKGFFKGVLFFPYLMNSVAVAIIFQRFFLKGQPPITPDGTLNTILNMFGMDSILWFDVSKPIISNICLVFISLWKYIGFDIIMYLGAIQSISPDLYEAARLDGANPFQTFKYLVFPSIKPIISLQLILSVKGAISVFEIPYIVTGGSFGTTTFVIKTMDTAFKKDKIGLASAMGVVLLIICCVVTAVQKAFFSEADDKPKKVKKSKGGIL